jgi:uncharacterized protein
MISRSEVVLETDRANKGAATDGSGHGGGLAIQAAALDSRIKAVITQVPALSGAIDAEIYPSGLLDKAQCAVAKYTREQSAEPDYIPVFPSSDEEVQSDPRSAIIGGEGGFWFYNFIQSLAGGVELEWENKVTLQSAYNNFKHEFRAYLPRIRSKPILYVSSSGSSFPAKPHQEAFKTIVGTKEFIKIEPFDFASYVLGTGAQNVKLEVEFLRRVLR